MCVYDFQNEIRKIYGIFGSFQQISAKKGCKCIVYQKKMSIFAGNFSQMGIEIVNKNLKDKNVLKKCQLFSS